VRTLERTVAYRLLFAPITACAGGLPLSAPAQVTEAPAADLPTRQAVALRPNEVIKVRHGLELLTGRFVGWNGDSLALQFDIGDLLMLPMEEVGQIAARRRSPDRAVGAGLLFGAIAWLTFKAETALGGGFTQCRECVNNSDLRKRTGRVVLVTTSLFLVADYVRPRYRVVYRRPADCC